MRKLLLFGIMILWLSMCTGRGEHRWLSRWPASATPGVDSLTDRVERGVNLAWPADSVEAELARMHAACSTHDDSLRARFLTGRILRMEGNVPEARRLYSALRSGIDSASYPYLWARIRREEVLLTDSLRMAYEVGVTNLQYFRSIRDTFMIASTLTDLSTTMQWLRDWPAALQYAREGQRLFRAMGLDYLGRRADINIALHLEHVADTASSDSLYRLLLSDTALKRDHRVRELIVRNMFIKRHEQQYIDEAIALCRADSSLRPLLPLELALKANSLFLIGKLKEGVPYADEAHRLEGLLQDADYHAVVSMTYAQEMEIAGHPDSALKYVGEHLMWMKRAERKREAGNVQSLEMQRRVARQESEAEARRMGERMTWIITVLTIVGAGGWVIFMFYRRSQRERLRRAGKQLELERSQRNIAAKMLAMEEKEKLISEMKRELRNADRGGNSAETVRQLSNMLKLHSSSAEEREGFEQVMEQVSPQFVEALRREYPELAEAYVKLASYIYAGLTNAQIARLLMIRPESVHQARWRLSRRMGLAKASELEDALRALARANGCV